MNTKLALGTIIAQMHEVTKMLAQGLGIDPTHLNTQEGMRRVALFCSPEKVKGIDYGVLEDILRGSAPMDDQPLATNATERAAQIKNALEEPSRLTFFELANSMVYRVPQEQRVALKAAAEKELAGFAEKFRR